MISNRLKERLVLLGGTIGIGAISLVITLTVYNVQIVKESEMETKEEKKIVYNDDLTKEQRKVAENLIAKLDELKVDSSSSDIKEEKQVDNDVELQNNELILETVAKVNKKISFIKPVTGDIGMIFSDDKLVYSKTLNEWLTHKALDILAEEGTEVKVSADGNIKEMYEDTRYGFTIVVEHDDGYITKYSGVAENDSLKIGMSLKQGDVISQISEVRGFEFAEGSHLHFEILKDGKNIEPEFI